MFIFLIIQIYIFCMILTYFYEIQAEHLLNFRFERVP